MTPEREAAPSFDITTAGRILFGAGRVKEAASAVRAFGRRILLVTGGNPDRASALLGSLTTAGAQVDVFPVTGEPTTLHVASGVARARLKGIEVLIGFGGGSVIDTAKAIAGLLTNERDLFDYLEVVGRGQSLTKPAAPWVAIPTTAGAGAEVTRNAVLTSREHKVKASLRSPFLLPRLAIVDPELTLGLPPSITASTGLDALTQLIEPYVCTRPNPVVDGWCLEGMERVARSLPVAFRTGTELEARTDMALAALLGGLALANAGLGAVHGLASPLGGLHPAPHGAVCAALLAATMSANVGALRAREPESRILRRYDRVARVLTGRRDATADDGVRWVRELVQSMTIPALHEYGVTRGELGDLADRASAASSMKSNPIVLTRDEVIGILEQAL